jgi:hypothetical protein
MWRVPGGCVWRRGWQRIDVLRAGSEKVVDVKVKAKAKAKATGRALSVARAARQTPAPRGKATHHHRRNLSVLMPPTRAILLFS